MKNINTNYDIPAMPLWMGVRDVIERNRLQQESQKTKDKNPCPVCGKEKGKQQGSDRYKELFECECGAIY